MENKNDDNILSFKDEGDFYTIKLTKDGTPAGNGMYPFGSLVVKHFRSKQECKKFAKRIGFRYEFS